MKRIIALVFLLSVSFALYPGNISITPFEYKSFGNESLPEFNISVSADCPGALIKQHTLSNGVPVADAGSYLKYVQYQVPLISSGITDSSGFIAHQLPGNISYYTGIFTLTVEKAGYRKQEVHFEISGCFVNVTPPTPPPNVTPPTPECTTDNDCESDEFCSPTTGNCTTVTGACGYAANHKWVSYKCCADKDCLLPSRFCNTTTHTCMNITVAPNITAECTRDGDCLPALNCTTGEYTVPPRCINSTCLRNVCELPVQTCPLGVVLLLIPVIAIGRYNAH